MRNVTQVTQGLKAIPKERWAAKLRRGALGVFLLAFAILAAQLAWPWYVAVGLVMAGAHVISADITRAFGDYFLALFKDVWATVKGKGEPPSPPPSAAV